MKSASQSPQYYKSWASYVVPMKPVEPIDYEDTKGLNSFYLAYYDKKGNLIRFIKYLQTREPRGIVSLKMNTIVGEKRYFDPAQASAQNVETPWMEIPYAATEHLSEYIEANFSGDENVAVLSTVKRVVFFVDEYDYWPNGKLKSRVLTKLDGSVRTEEFDLKAD